MFLHIFSMGMLRAAGCSKHLYISVGNGKYRWEASMLYGVLIFQPLSWPVHCTRSLWLRFMWYVCSHCLQPDCCWAFARSQSGASTHTSPTIVEWCRGPHDSRHKPHKYVWLTLSLFHDRLTTHNNAIIMTFLKVVARETQDTQFFFLFWKKGINSVKVIRCIFLNDIAETLLVQRRPTETHTCWIWGSFIPEW